MNLIGYVDFRILHAFGESAKTIILLKLLLVIAHPFRWRDHWFMES